MSDDATSDMSDVGWRLARLIDGFMMTQMLYVAAKLNIAGVLSTGPRSGADIAAEVGAQSQPLTRLLRGLSAEGVLDETGDGRFALTPLGEALGHMRGAAIARGEIYFHSAEQLLDGVREGGVPFELARGAEFFDYLHEHPEHEQVFQSAMSGRSANEARAVVAAYDFGRFERIVDVGGGHGVLLTTILEAAVDVDGVLFDQGSVVAEAQSKLDGSPVRSRIRFVGGDFFEQIPPGGDAYVLSRILHDWDDDNVAHILARCRAAMDVDTRLLIAECVLPEDAKDNPGAIWMDVLMLLLLRSRERSESEFRHLLHANGFELLRVIPTGSLGGLALLEARDPSEGQCAHNGRWFHGFEAGVEAALMTDDEVLAAVEQLLQNQPERAVSVGEVTELLDTSDVDEVTMHLEQLREAGKIFRSTATESDRPPAVLTYTLYE